MSVIEEQFEKMYAEKKASPTYKLPDGPTLSAGRSAQPAPQVSGMEAIVNVISDLRERAEKIDQRAFEAAMKLFGPPLAAQSITNVPNRIDEFGEGSISFVLAQLDKIHLQFTAIEDSLARLQHI